MTELLRGRQRRYFGYSRDIKHKVDTPESAKSFRSVLSNTQNAVKRKYEPKKTFKPDPAGRSHFADRIIHRAVKTEIPGLLPALNNSSQFEKDGENLLKLRSPNFEKQFERSLHYLWLKKNDRKELCDYFNKHLRTKEKTRFRQVKQVKKLTGAAAETYAIEQQDYLESLVADPKVYKQKRVSEVPSRIFRQNRKFQASYWDPVKFKSVPDPFRRTKTKTPALDSICHEYWGVSPEYADLMTCVNEYNRRQQMNEELTADIELSDAKEQARRVSLFGSLEDEERRRGFKHIKQLKEYDIESEELWKQQAKLMISAATYINKIKAGRRFPTPPREAQKKKNRGRAGSDGEECCQKQTVQIQGVAASKAPSSIDVYDFIEKKRLPSPTREDPLKGMRGKRYPPLPGTPKKGDKYAQYEPEEIFKGVHHHHSHHDHHGKRKHRHFHHDYHNEDFYMEMYLHFLNPDEDVSLKSNQTQMTDVKELRKKMHLDEDHEQDKKLIDMLNADSIEALHVHRGERQGRKTMVPEKPKVVEEEDEDEDYEGDEEETETLKPPERDPHQLTAEELQHEKEVLLDHLQRLNNPRLTHMLTKVISQLSISLRSSYPTISGASDSKVVTPDDDVADDMLQTSSLTGIPGTRDEDLDLMGDVPENELKMIMTEIADSNESMSSEALSSGSSQGEEEEEGEGEVEGANQELQLFKTVKKKKDSLAEFMDLTAEFRARVCKNEEGKNPAQMNPFAEAVCVLYHEGKEKKKKQDKMKEQFEKSMAHLH